MPITSERPKRQYVKTVAIVEHWVDRRPDLRWSHIGLGEPFCFRCGWLAPVKASPDGWERTWRDAAAWLDRAHIIDRANDGLDGPQNLVLLCPPCHRAMPVFSPGDEKRALAWVFDRSQPCPWLFQMMTDDEEYPVRDRHHVVRRWRLYCETMARGAPVTSAA